MALSNSSKVPAVVVDLTAESDFKSDDEAKSAPYTTAVTSKPPTSPSPQNSAATHVSKPATGSSLSLSSGSLPTIDPPIRTEATLAPSVTMTPSVGRPATTAMTASSGRRATMSNSNGQVQTAATAAAAATMSGSLEAERRAKRRKLSREGRMPLVLDGLQAQNKGHSDTMQHSTIDAIAPTPARASPAVAASTSLRARLKNTNAAPSVNFMNAALKPSASSIPVLDDMPTQAARPLFISRLSHARPATGLLSPGLTSPESVSAMVLNSDPLEPMEMEASQPNSPVRLEARKQDVSGNAAVSTASMLTSTVHALSASRHVFIHGASSASSSAIVEHKDEDGVVGDLPLRQSTTRDIKLTSTRDMEQTPTFARSDPPAVSPRAPTPNQRAGSTNSGFQLAVEDQLIIFLKEVKRFKWTEITKEYLKDYPDSNYGRIQSRYSSFLNKRDRTQDPASLVLPSRFAAEAVIDWTSVHANTQPPRVRKEVANSGNMNPDVPRHAHVTKPQAAPRAMQQIIGDADSSSGESAPQRHRSRRGAPVNYTWPQLRTVKGGFEELPDDAGDPTPHSRARSGIQSRSGSPSDKTPIITGSSRTINSKPLDPEFSHRDSKLGLDLQRNAQNAQQVCQPYLSSSQRLAVHESPEGWIWDQSSMQDWQGAILHVDFSPTELQIVEKVIAKSIPSVRQTHHSTYRRRLRAILKGLTSPKLQQLAHETGRHLRSRDIRSIRCFLEDAAAGKVSDVPQVKRLALKKPDSRLHRTQLVSTSSHVRQRELGLQTKRGLHAASTPVTYQLKNQLTDTLGPKSTWTGASSDIHTVAWSPDGQCFAAGAVAVTDSDSMQYNRPNVLMYGDTIAGNIYELAKHWIDREQTENGANSTHAMYASQDPKLFTTVSSVAFSPSGRLMYSAGYDHSVCIWDVSANSQQPYMIRELQHQAPVDVLAVNPACGGMLATGTKRTTEKSIKLVKFSEEAIYDEPWPYTRSNFASTKAVSRPDLRMSANALKFDMTGRYLLAGFGANLREDSGFHTSGDICLWDVESETALSLHGSSRNVFDVTFDPRPGYHGLFAVGCVANGNVNRGTRSVVRFYAFQKDDKITCPLEIECKALDMNDVVWCPYDGNLFAAGCTDGRSYLWDLRKPHQPLCILGHGSSLMPLQDDVPHERTDTGVRFLSWGQNARRLYSGSSDGVVKIWDVMQSQEDVFVKDLITTNSGIMSGAFSYDYSKLILGEVNGTANVLEVGRDDVALKDADKLTYCPYVGREDDDTCDLIVDRLLPEATDFSAAEARKWLETGQLRLAPMGGLPKQQVIQGPNYEGPFDHSKDSYTLALREEAFRFQHAIATIKGPQCGLFGCADNVNTTTYEDVGEYGRSVDRIPDELRRQWLDETLRVVPGKSKCTHCGRPAVPSLDGKAISCENHSFSCLRCGSTSEIAMSTSVLRCSLCAGEWEIGALGYECCQRPEKIGGDFLHVPALEKFGKESYLERIEDADTAFGDEINALTDYYFGLAIDRPETPPL